MITPVIANKAKIILHLNRFKTFGTSMKKFEYSTSFPVAPHVTDRGISRYPLESASSEGLLTVNLKHMCKKRL